MKTLTVIAMLGLAVVSGTVVPADVAPGIWTPRGMTSAESLTDFFRFFFVLPR